MRKANYVLLMAFMSLTLIWGCDYTPDSDQVQRDQQEKQLAEQTRQVGMPAVPNAQEKKNLKMIIELRDNNKILNYAYTFSEMTGKFSYIGKCIGFPIPYATQYTNPQKIEERYQSGYAILPQADPNGLFSPASAEATWIFLVNPKTGESKPMYMEPKVTVVPFPLPDEVCTINVKEK